MLEMSRIYMLYPNMIPQVGALSLGGNLFTCVMLDPVLTKDSDKLPELFIEELKELGRRLNVDISPDSMYATSV